MHIHFFPVIPNLIMKYLLIVIWVISIMTGKMIPILAKATEMSKNLRTIFLYFAYIWTL